MQKTLSIIKPDAIKRNLSGAINSMIEKELKIVGQKMIYLNKLQASLFYAEHKNRAFFDELVNMMILSPIIVQALEAENAIEIYRALIGNTDPSVAQLGTIRNKFGIDIGQNSVHGSADLESANHEISFFFSKLEIYSF